MAERRPFVLLDDARETGAADALLFENPQRVFVAHRAEQVAGRSPMPITRAAKAASWRAISAMRRGSRSKTAACRPPRRVRSGGAGLAGVIRRTGPIPARRNAANGLRRACRRQRRPARTAGFARWLCRGLRAAAGGDPHGRYLPGQPDPSAGRQLHGDPLALYGALRPAAQAGYGGVVFDGSHWLLSLSPELFVSLKGNEAKAKPMKGTRPRAKRAPNSRRAGGRACRIGQGSRRRTS